MNIEEAKKRFTTPSIWTDHETYLGFLVKDNVQLLEALWKTLPTDLISDFVEDFYGEYMRHVPDYQKYKTIDQ